MALHKMVNGKKIDLTPEEEEKVLKEWELNRIKKEQELEEKKVIDNLRKQAKEKIFLSANLSADEIKSLEKW